MEYPKVEKEIFNVGNENLQKLASLFPSVVKDGQLDIEALKEEIGQVEEVGQEKYELNWAGKQNAKKEVRKNISGKTLRYIEGDGVDEDNTQNIYIEGDNLEVLKLLKKNYYGRIKMIYIDPPYNTGNDFVYNDDFSISSIEAEKLQGIRDKEGKKLQKNSKDSSRFHTNWLNMMYPRLRLSKDLLDNDGVIFISIDDNEQANLKKLCDEIFGEHNFITMFAVENNPKGRKNNIFVSESYEHCLLYAKNKSYIYGSLGTKKKFFNGLKSGENTRQILKDEHGEFKQSKRQVCGTNKSNPLAKDSKPERCFTIYFSSADNDMKLLDEYDKDSDKWVLSPKGQNLLNNGYKRYCGYDIKTLKPSVPLYSKDTMYEYFRANKLYFKEDGTIYEKDRDDTKQINSFIPNKKYDLNLMTESATSKMEQLFGVKDIFTSSKSVDFVKALINLYPGSDFTVLDFFSGSGTTAHAVMQLNADDNGKRKFILVQFREETDKGSQAKKAGFNNICEIGKKRIKLAGCKIKEEWQTRHCEQQSIEEVRKKPDCFANARNDNSSAPDIGFKVFRVGETTLNWEKLSLQGADILHDYLANASDKDKLDFTPDYQNDLNVVYEIMLRQVGLPLTSNIEKLTDIGSRTYLVAECYLISLEENITSDMIKKLSELNPLPIKFVFRDCAFDDNIVLKDETFRRLNALINKNTNDEKKTYTVEFI